MIKGSLKNMFTGKAYISNTQLHSVVDLDWRFIHRVFLFIHKSICCGYSL